MDAIQHTAPVAVNDNSRADHDDDERLLDNVHRWLANRCAHTDDIKAAICQFYCLERSTLTLRLRVSEVTFARQMFCFLAYRYTRLSLQAVGLKAGLTNHTTVLHAVRRIEKFIVTRPLVADDVEVLRIKIFELTMARRRAGTC